MIVLVNKTCGFKKKLKFHIIVDSLASSTPSSLIRASKRNHSPKLSLFLLSSLSQSSFVLSSLPRRGIRLSLLSLSLNHQALINAHVCFLSSPFLLCPPTVISIFQTQPWPCPFSQSFLFPPHNSSLLSHTESATAFHTSTI